LAVLYDGHCNFCRGQMSNLVRLARSGAVEPVDFQAVGALDRYENVTHAQCMQSMIVVAPDQRTWTGAEAFARVLMTRPILGKVAYLYYVPGLKHLADWIYGIVARHRYRIAGRAVAGGDCDSGACQLHFDAPKKEED